jgi:hypothetical protein
VIRTLGRLLVHQGIVSFDIFRRLAGRAGFTSRFEVRAGDDGWMITQRGSSLPLRVFKKKGDAVREAKKMAKDMKAQLNVFQKNGRLQSSLVFT